MKKANIKIVLIIIFLILFCLFFTKIGINRSNDTFYLLKLGKTILKNGIDLKDHFSWISDLSYTYPHWLYSLIIYFFYHSWSFNGIFLLNFISYSLIIIVIFLVNLKMNKNVFIAFLVAFISIFTIKSFILPRSIVLSTIMFFLEVFFIHQLLDTGKKKYIFFLFFLSLLLANIHATSWIMFFILFLPFFGEAFISRIKQKKWNLDNKIEIEKKQNIKLLLIAFFVSFLAGLLSPSRICYTYVFKIMQGNSQLYISEHSPLIIIQKPIVFIMLFLLYFSNSKIKMHEFFMIFGLTIMTFASYRHILFFYTIVFLYLSIILMRNITSNKKNDYTMNFFNRLLSNKFLIFAIMILIIFSFNNVKKNLKENLDEKEYPIDAVNYIKNNRDKYEKYFFNEYDYGSFLIFNDIKVFVDSRCDLYLKEFNAKTEVLNDYFDVLDNYNLINLIDKYNIMTLLLSKNGMFYNLIKHDQQFAIVYEDENFVIYERIDNEVAYKEI